MDLEDPLVPIVCFNFIFIKIYFYFIFFKTKAVTKKDIGLVLMEGHAVRMELVFVNLVLMVQCVNYVELVSLCKYKLSSIILLFRYWL
jgi:hypothetical protein